MFYFISFSAALLAYLFYNVKKHSRNYKSWFYYFVSIIVIITALRKLMYFPDLAGYEYFFNHGESIDVSSSNENVEFLYKWLNDILRGKIHFQFYCALLALFIIGTYAVKIFKWSPYPFFSLFIFILVNYIPSCFLLRQYIAMSICVISFKYVISRQQIKYLSLIALAAGFHISALVVLPLYYLYGMEPKKKDIYLTIFCGLFLSFFISILLRTYIPSYLGDYYIHYLESDSEGSVVRIIMKSFLLASFLLATKCSFTNKGILYLIFLLMLLSIVICIVALDVPIFFRLRDFFSLSEIVGIPVIVAINKNNRDFRGKIVNAMVVVYVMLLIYSFNNYINNDNMNIRYAFFWM